LICPRSPRRPGGIPTRALASVALLAALLVLPTPTAAQLPPLVTQTIHFEVPGHDLIPLVAAFRASCDIVASGEPLALKDNESTRTTIAASPGNCSMILILFGVDVAIPTISTTPMGRSSFYIPGASTISLGVVDVSLDLRTSLNSTAYVGDPNAATLGGQGVDWGTWGATRLVVHGAHGYGGFLASNLTTEFTYSLALGITLWIAGIETYHTDLADFGHYLGDHALVTPLSVDLLPHPLALGPATQVTYAGARLSWTGTVEPDEDHLELWIASGQGNVSYGIEDPHTTGLNVDLRAATTYTARIVAVDHAGQESISPAITFRTLSAPPAEPSPAPTYTESQANLVVTATFLFIALLAALVGYGFGRLRGGT
jgi:hypothetical protein